ncbi:hypothetical protein HID58_083324 [Brassica napus]|uniref:Uncharacterized protein n=1 Tax=Brassica napus TaxID=3708 RepID=A0ABQ7YFP0_BRANA|nr:hypothetical protein HID58_083324 [Brassica napus]
MGPADNMNSNLSTAATKRQAMQYGGKKQGLHKRSHVLSEFQITGSISTTRSTRTSSSRGPFVHFTAFDFQTGQGTLISLLLTVCPHWYTDEAPKILAFYIVANQRLCGTTTRIQALRLYTTVHLLNRNAISSRALHSWPFAELNKNLPPEITRTPKAINPQGHQNFCHLYLQLIYVLRNLLYLLHKTTNSRLLVYYDHVPSWSQHKLQERLLSLSQILTFDASSAARGFCFCTSLRLEKSVRRESLVNEFSRIYQGKDN